MNVTDNNAPLLDAKPSSQSASSINAKPDQEAISRQRRSLDAIFTPRSIAVIGATETAGSVGRTVLWNLIHTPFGGPVFPVNPKRGSVLGVKAYPKVKDVPECVDLAVIVTPAGAVPSVVGECVDAGVRAAIIISAGFKELGSSGVDLERRVLEQARRGGMRLIGPNCLGVMNPLSGLNATFAKGIARPGNIAFISQSGALCTAILDWSLREQVGFSGFVSTGSMLDISWGDLIDHYGEDRNTKAILIYMESIGDARSFLSAAREVALTKPIIVIKPGRTEQAARAAASHTGSLTGGDDVIDAAFRRCGVLRVNNISDLFYMAEILAHQPRPRGPRLTIITNAGGPGVLATDALITTGGELATLSPETMKQLNALLPAAWSRNNPIDVLGDAPADRYAKALEIAATDPNSDGLLVILTPQDMTNPTATADLLKQYTLSGKSLGKPILASWMGGADIAPGEQILNGAGIPTFAFPDTAARMFTYLWRYTYNLRGLYETPAVSPDGDKNPPDQRAAAQLIGDAHAAGRTLLTEFESKSLLSAFGIPTVSTEIALDAEQAVRCAEELGYPVVLKLHSYTITHKTDVGGILLNLTNSRAVEAGFESIRQSVTKATDKDAFNGVTVQPMVKLKDAYELILGSSIDREFGPVLLFGTGGQLVEVFKDRSLALPPLNATLARRMMEQTKIFSALKGVRGRAPVDIARLEQLLVRFSQLVAEQRWIKEIDINPLLASPERLLALDARIVLHSPETDEQRLPRLAIRPYPSKYVRTWKTREGLPVTIRPICPEDEPMVIAFHRTLSDETVQHRYHGSIALERRTSHERLTRVCFNDYTRELALVVESAEPSQSARQILAIGRLSRIPGSNDAELALLVSDAMQHHGFGTELNSNLVSIARAEKISNLHAYTTRDNHAMKRILEKANFTLQESNDSATVSAHLQINS
jgi:acetyltransferase